MSKTTKATGDGELWLGPVLEALADPHRRRVVVELAGAADGTERTCQSFELPVSKSSLTYHFRVLEESGLIANVDYGNRRGVSLRRDAIERSLPGLLDAVTEGERRSVGASATSTGSAS
ncbi:helix-turn-helix domain-containing protein [Patulibacter sp. NPDC049589]|uniref:ArsR/SmtB family transcription factor n=1 Tax=Patulibacter sp. NPDC049589 TaxID=3154731 RepID=UPI00343CE857